MQRCKWCNLSNPLYVKYHDEEWCVFNNDEHYLYEMLILESFQAGLSFECILNKIFNFEKAYDNFDINKIINYQEDKINELLQNKGIIRNKLKIKASINNSIIFKKIQLEFGFFIIIYSLLQKIKFIMKLIKPLHLYRMNYQKI